MDGDRPRERTEEVGDVAPAMVSVLIGLEPEKIALFKAIIESYDNLATMRTEDPARNRIRLWFDPDAAGDIDRIFSALAPEFGLHRFA